MFLLSGWRVGFGVDRETSCILWSLRRIASIHESYSWPRFCFDFSLAVEGGDVDRSDALRLRVSHRRDIVL